jgi:hypothetical protein
LSESEISPLTEPPNLEEASAQTEGEKVEEGKKEGSDGDKEGIPSHG